MDRSVGSLLLGAIGLAAAAWLMGGHAAPSAGRADGPAAGASPSTKPAAKLRIRLGKFDGKPDELLDPAAKGWQAAPVTRVLLNRTPRVYQTEKPRPARPALVEVRAMRAGGKVVFRLEWEDATRDAPEAPPRRKGDGGEGKPHKRPTGRTNSFADAAAVMVPKTYRGGEFPSLVMGDSHAPVRLYYWNASRGAEVLKASGRARVEPTGKALRHKARHANGRWTLTLEAPDIPTPSPAAFAIWDGSGGDRNGLKMFSIWYVLE
jgi:hypothetical protein